MTKAHTTKNIAKNSGKNAATSVRKQLRIFIKICIFIILLPYLLSILYFVLPAPSTLMIADWLRFREVRRSWVNLDKISPSLASAVITAEDSAFCGHFGVDLQQIEKSVAKAQATNRPIRGTSTITQQLAKNLFLWHGRSWIRKTLEMPLAFWLELIWSKRRIIETYLNVVEWGEGIYGAEAAAKFHFNISAQRLSSHQSALLATSLPNPKRRSASNPAYHQINLAGQLVARMQHSTPDLSCLQ